jgi:Pvc16 N-terminal domain
VIHDADRSLAAWVGTMLGSGTTVRFDAPDPAWVRDPPAQPFVDIFLYDIAQDINGLSTEAVLIRDPDGRAVARQPQARRYRLSYLLTAWSADVETDHEMLGSVMAACADAAVIPGEFLHGTLAEAGLPVELRCAPPREISGVHDGAAGLSTAGLCQAFGVPPRAALALILMAPLIPAARSDVAPPARSIDLDVAALPVSSGEEPQPPGERRTHRRWERARITEHRA